jgi:hypothetical protein
MNWIPAFAGMTAFFSNGKSRLNPYFRLVRKSVIPAKAGIQQKILLRAAINTFILSCFAGVINHLDTGLRRYDGTNGNFRIKLSHPAYF